MKIFETNNSLISSVHFRIVIADTVIDGHDSGGNRRPVVFLNGSFGTQRDWNKVLKNLGDNYRTITYDERARGKSKKSTNYTFEGCLDDLSAVIRETNIQHPILVGWSFGAAVAAMYVATHANDVSGLLLIDGAYPTAQLTEDEKEKVLHTFQKIRFILPILTRFGKMARMSAHQAANINIELHDICGKIESAYDNIYCPTYFICALKSSMGHTEDQINKKLISIELLKTNHQNISIFKTLSCTHMEIISKYSETIIDAITDLNQEFQQI